MTGAESWTLALGVLAMILAPVVLWVVGELAVDLLIGLRRRQRRLERIRRRAAIRTERYADIHEYLAALSEQRRLDDELGRTER